MAYDGHISELSWRSRRWLKFGAGVLSIGLLMVSYQNCSAPAPPSESSANSKLSEEMDFSYDASLDQITYMSCPFLKGNYDPDMLFSFRVGAYRTGGVRLKSEFYQTYAKKTPERMIDLLANSKSNANTALQVAVRQVGTLNSLVSATGAPKKGSDFANMLVQLGTVEMSTHLVTTGLDTENSIITGKRTKFMRDGTNRGAHMEATLHFGESEALASDLREGFLNSGRAVLAMTYIEPSQSGNRETDVRTPHTVWPDRYKDDSGVAYGTAFQLSFDKPSGSKGLMERDNLGNLVTPPRELSTYPMNHLTSVTERNLAANYDKRTLGSWTCPTTLRFRIVRPEDLTEGDCRRLPDPEPAVISAEQKIARNSLRYEDWYMDWDKKCIIPKKSSSSCYGDLNYVQYAYTGNEGCDKNSTTSSNAVKSKACLAWASVCYRTN